MQKTKSTYVCNKSSMILFFALDLLLGILDVLDLLKLDAIHFYAKLSIGICLEVYFFQLIF
jgi:hypothetical protein